MKLTSVVFLFCLVIAACTPEADPQPAPAPVAAGPIGGTYNFSGSVTRSYDTIMGTGITTMNEYLVTTSNFKGIATINANTITSKALIFDYTLTGTKKEMNTTTGATVTTAYAPISGSRGTSTTSYASNYTINTTAGELTVNDGQYLFNPSFLTQPADGRHKYNLTGNTLKVTTEYYSPADKSRYINEASFTRQ